MASEFFRTASIFWLQYGTDADWELTDYSVPSPIATGFAHSARGVFDLNNEIAAGRLDLTSPVTVTLAITNYTALAGAVLYFSDKEMWVTNDNGEIKLTLDSTMLTRGGTLPGRFLLEVVSDAPTPFTVQWRLAPSAPTLAAAAGTALVNLSWTVPTSGITPFNYRVYRAQQTGGPYTLIADTLTSTTYTDTTVTGGVMYYYVVTAYNTYGESPYSNEAAARPYNAVSVPPAPATLVASWAVSSDAYIVQLQWPVASNALSYVVDFSLNGSTWTTLGGISAAQTNNFYNAYIAENSISGLKRDNILYFRVSGANSAGTGSPSPIATIQAYPAPVLAFTQDLTGLHLTWTIGSGATPKAFNLYRTDVTAGNPLENFAVVAGTTFAYDESSSTVTWVAGHTYVIYVDSQFTNAENAYGGDITNQSNIVNVSKGSTINPPANVQATQNGVLTIQVTWSPASGLHPPFTYQVYVASTALGPWTLKSSNATTPYAFTVSATGNYYVKLTATDTTAQVSTASNIAGVTVKDLAPQAPVLTASSTYLAGTIWVSWTIPTSYDGTLTYKLYRSTTSGGPYTLQYSGTAAVYADVAITTNVPYYYVVVATDTYGTSVYSNQASAMLAGTTLVPLTPSFITGQWETSANQIDIQWDLTSDQTIDYYTVYGSTDNITFTSLGNYTLNIQSVFLSGVTNDQTVYLYVKAHNSVGYSAASPTATVVGLAAPPLGTLTLTWSAGAAQVGLNASKPSTNVNPASYNIYRSQYAAGPFTLVSNQPPQPSFYDLIWTDTGPFVAGQGYYYYVTAVYANSVESKASATQSVVITSLTTPALTASSNPTSISLSWSASTYVGSGSGSISYQVWRATTANGTFTQIASSVVLVTYTDSAVTVGNTYWYYVVASDGTGVVSNHSNTVSAAPSATGPTITSNPSNQSITVGGLATFTVVATGTAPLSYQWYKGSVTLPGATNATYQIPNCPLTAAGTYKCLVSNVGGSVFSTSATLTVSPASVGACVITSPTAATSQTINEGATAPTLAVTANGYGNTLTYQWSLNGTVIVGATASTYTLSSTAESQAGQYTCQVSNNTGPAPGGGTVTSPTMTIKVTNIPAVATLATAMVTGVTGTINVGTTPTPLYTSAGTFSSLPQSGIVDLLWGGSNLSQMKGRYQLLVAYTGGGQLEIINKLTYNKNLSSSDSTWFYIDWWPSLSVSLSTPNNIIYNQTFNTGPVQPPPGLTYDDTITLPTTSSTAALLINFSFLVQQSGLIWTLDTQLTCKTAVQIQPFNGIYFV